MTAALNLIRSGASVGPLGEGFLGLCNRGSEVVLPVTDRRSVAVRCRGNLAVVALG